MAHVLLNREVQMAMTPSPAQDAVSAPNKSQEEVEENGQSAGEVQGGERSSLRLGSISRPVTRYDCFTDAISFYFSSKGAAETGEAPVKRGRGRPKGSKNKKGLGDAAAPAPDTPKKKRGRPPKVGRFLKLSPRPPPPARFGLSIHLVSYLTGEKTRRGWRTCSQEEARSSS